MTSKAIDEVAGWVDVIRVAQQQIAQKQEVIAHARERIEDALGDAEVGTVDGAPAVRWTYVTSTRFDQKKAKAILGDEADACMTETTTRRFTLVGGAE